MVNKSRRRRNLQRWCRYADYCIRFDVPNGLPNGLVKIHWPGYNKAVVRVVMDEKMMEKAQKEAAHLAEFAE